MRRWGATCVAFLLVSAVLNADLTMTQTVSVEGGPTAMMGGVPTPTITMRIKGLKARVETEGMGPGTVMLTDLATKQMIMLNAADKTARVIDAASPLVPSGTPMPEMDVTFKPTGQKRKIDDRACDEYAIALTMDMASMLRGNAEKSPEAAQMLLGLKMIATGSSWIATSGPGIEEFTAFQKASAGANMQAAIAGAMGGSNNGFDRILAASAAIQGIPYMTEMTMSVEGTGQIVDMMRQMGAMKITNKVTAISTDVLADDLFKVPAGYTMVK